MVNAPPEWTLILPTLDEEHNLGPLLDSILRLPLSRRAEILIIDGGSTDGTHEVYLKWARKHPRLHWFDMPPGKAAALRRGFGLASGRYIAFMDADGQYPPQALAQVCKTLEAGADLVVTCRQARHPNLVRRALSLGYANVIGRGLLHLPVHDPQSGLKAIRKDVLSKIHLNAHFWDLDVQLISGAQAAGAFIQEVDIEFLPRIGGRSKTHILSTSSNLLVSGLQMALSPPSASSSADPYAMPDPNEVPAAVSLSAKKGTRKSARSENWAPVISPPSRKSLAYRRKSR